MVSIAGTKTGEGSNDTDANMRGKALQSNGERDSSSAGVEGGDSPVLRNCCTIACSIGPGKQETYSSVKEKITAFPLDYFYRTQTSTDSFDYAKN